MLQNKLEKFTKKEALINEETTTETMELEETSNGKTQVMDKGTNTYQVNIKTHKYANPIEVRITSISKYKLWKTQVHSPI